MFQLKIINEEVVEGLLKGYWIKKSSISRHFVKATAEQMKELMERDLSGPFSRYL